MGWLSCLTYQVPKGDVLLSDEDLDDVGQSGQLRGCGGTGGNSRGRELCSS